MNRLYVTSKTLAELQTSLTERQRAILQTLDRVRLATSLQLERLHFPDVTRRQARRALTRMASQRLLLRLPRVVGGSSAGSAGYVFGLDAAGARLLAPDVRRRRQPWNVGLPFLAHTLAVTELYVRLVEAHRLGHLELASFTTEPACWRSFSGAYGRATLKPDAYVVARLDRYEDSWFIEADRSTEPASTLMRKCEQYRRYWQTGREQDRTGVFPRVLWLVPDRRRHDVLVSVFGRQPADTWHLFTVTTFDEAVTRIAQGAEQ